LIRFAHTRSFGSVYRLLLTLRLFFPLRFARLPVRYAVAVTGLHTVHALLVCTRPLGSLHHYTALLHTLAAVRWTRLVGCLHAVTLLVGYTFPDWLRTGSRLDSHTYTRYCGFAVTGLVWFVTVWLVRLHRTPAARLHARFCAFYRRVYVRAHSSGSAPVDSLLAFAHVTGWVRTAPPCYPLLAFTAVTALCVTVLHGSNIYILPHALHRFYAGSRTALHWLPRVHHAQRVAVWFVAALRCLPVTVADCRLRYALRLRDLRARYRFSSRVGLRSLHTHTLHALTRCVGLRGCVTAFTTTGSRAVARVYARAFAVAVGYGFGAVAVTVAEHRLDSVATHTRALHLFWLVTVTLRLVTHVARVPRTRCVRVFTLTHLRLDTRLRCCFTVIGAVGLCWIGCRLLRYVILLPRVAPRSSLPRFATFRFCGLWVCHYALVRYYPSFPDYAHGYRLTLHVFVTWVAFLRCTRFTCYRYFCGLRLRVAHAVRLRFAFRACLYARFARSRAPVRYVCHTCVHCARCLAHVAAVTRCIPGWFATDFCVWLRLFAR